MKATQNVQMYVYISIRYTTAHRYIYTDCVQTIINILYTFKLSTAIFQFFPVLKTVMVQISNHKISHSTPLSPLVGSHEKLWMAPANIIIIITDYMI